MSRWEQRIGGPLRTLVGVPLDRAVLSSFEGDLDTIPVDAEEFCYGGELWLHCGEASVCLSWEEQAGWPDDCSLRIAHHSLFRHDPRPPGWQTRDVSASPRWTPYIGRVLLGGRLFVQAGTPLAVELDFDGRAMQVGVGSRRGFASTDDLLVRVGARAAASAGEPAAWRPLFDEA